MALSFVAVAVLAVACADDNRPVAPLPIGGESNAAGKTSGGESSAGGGAAGDGSTQGGAPDGVAGQPMTGGQGNEAGAPAAAGAGGSGDGGAAGLGGAGGEEPPFAAPYYIVYAAPELGVDSRNPTAAHWNGGALVDWTSNLDSGATHRIGAAQNLDLGLDGVVQWGRWADGKLAGVDAAITLSSQQGFHYAIGTGTQTLPTSGTSSYEALGDTSVTLGDGSKEPGLVAVEATAAWGVTSRVGLTVNLTVGGVTYVVVTTGTYDTPATSEVKTWDEQHPAAFAGIPMQPTQGICSDGCSSSIQGFFAGPNADYLAFVVHLYDGAGGSASSISSVIVMKKK